MVTGFVALTLRRASLGLGVLEAALLLGVLGDALLRATPWGVNPPLWAGALAALVVALGRRIGSGVPAGARSWPPSGPPAAGSGAIKKFSVFGFQFSAKTTSLTEN